MKTNRDDERKDYWRDWTEDELLELRARQRPSPGKVSGTMRLAAFAQHAAQITRGESDPHGQTIQSAVAAASSRDHQGFRASLPMDGITDEFGGTLRNPDLVMTASNSAQSQLPIQRKESGEQPTNDTQLQDYGSIHSIAAQGVSGAGGSLPHLDTIQRSFGHHDVTDVQAHMDSAAATANQNFGSMAYATGNSVAFAIASPALHTAAHEAAHIVQQRAGVSLSDGVGKAGDRYEQHADAVADAVVSGKSVQGLLDQYGGGGGGGGGGVQAKAVQYDGQDEIPQWVRDAAPHAANSGTLGQIMNAVTWLQQARVTANQNMLVRFVRYTDDVLALMPSSSHAPVLARITQYTQRVGNLARTLKVLSVLGSIVAVVDIGLNVLSIITEVGEFQAGCDAFGGQYRTTESACRAAYAAFQRNYTTNTVTNFKYFMADRVSDYSNWGDEWSPWESTRRAANNYVTQLRALVNALSPILNAVSNIISAIVSIVTDVAGIVSLFLAPPAGLIVSACSAGASFINWVIQEFDLDDGAIQGVINVVNNYYIPNLFGSNISTETVFADLIL